METLEKPNRLTEGEGGISYHQLDDRDFDGVAVLCEHQGWGTEDHRQLCAVLPSAKHVARAGGQVIGNVAGMRCNVFSRVCPSFCPQWRGVHMRPLPMMHWTSLYKDTTPPGSSLTFPRHGTSLFRYLPASDIW